MQRVVAGFLLLAALAAAVSSSSSGSSSVASGTGAVVRMQLTHIDAGGGLTKRELLLRMAARSKARAARFLSKTRRAAARARFLSSSANLPVVPGLDTASQQAEYLVSFSIGTPPQAVKLNLDTGSDLIWTQTVPCPACYNQRPMPYFNASRSSTFSPLPCDSSLCQQVLSSCGSHGWPGNRSCVYTTYYADKSVTNGLLATDTFTFSAAAGGGGGAAAAGLAFGCGFFNQGLFDRNTTGTGIGGFGRGALSLPSQLKVDNFSYCFTNSTGSTPSPVLLGLPADLYAGSGGAAAVQTTPFVRSSFNPTYYYLNLKGITVGSTRLQVPESSFALKADGTGGTVIDSGSSFTSLPRKVYSLLVAALVSELKMTPVRTFGLGRRFCFPASATATVPKLQLHLEGAVMELPRDNFVFEVEDRTGQSVMCIAVTSGEDITIIGNYQQQNMHVLYDLAGNSLSFVPAQCDTV